MGVIKRVARAVGLKNARARLGSLAYAAARSLSPDVPPSFLANYQRARRNYKGALALTSRESGTLWDWETKLGVRQIAEAVGVATPRLLQGPVPIHQLDWHAFPESFVVKPNRGSTKAGVYVLRRTSDRSFSDLIRERTVTRDQVMQELAHLAGTGDISGDRMLVEEALLRSEDSIAFDWKCYAFQGEVALIWQISRDGGQRRTRYLDREWRDLGKARKGIAVTATLPPPDNPDSILETARRLSEALPIPFVRVDLYERDGRVYLGELTPMPGSLHLFSRPLDAELGRAWARAEAKLLALSTSADPRPERG